MRKVAFVIAMLLVCAYSIDAQESTGSIIGTVQDESGAAITGAEIEIRSLSFALSWRFKTGEKGDYLAPDLTPGVYTVKATAAGFSAHQYDRVEILLGKQSKLNFELSIQRALQTVTITEQPSPVDVHSNKAAMNLSRE